MSYNCTSRQAWKDSRPSIPPPSRPQPVPPKDRKRITPVPKPWVDLSGYRFMDAYNDPFKRAETKKPLNPPGKDAAKGEKSYSVEARFLNGFMGYASAHLRGYTAKKGPYTLEEAREVMKEVEEKMGAEKTQHNFEIRIIDKTGKVIVEIER